MTNPTKPGPTADRIAELEREIAKQEDLAARCLTEHKYIFHGRAQFLRAELSRLRNEQPKGGGAACPCCGGSGYERYLGRDNSEEVIDCSLCSPSAGPQDVRVDDSRVMKIWRQCGLPKWFLGNGGTNSKLVAFAAAFGQSSPPQDVRALAKQCRERLENGLANFHGNEARAQEVIADYLAIAATAAAALAQSDAQPTRWNLPPSSDQVFENRAGAFYEPQSDAQPVGWQYRCRTNELSAWSEWRDCDPDLANRLRSQLPFYEVRRTPQQDQISDEVRHSRKIEDGEWAVPFGDTAPPRPDASEYHAALAQSDAQPVGWRLVPTQITGEMEAELADLCHSLANDEFITTQEFWQRMLAVAPTPPHPPEGAREALGAAKNHLEEVLKYSVGGTFNRTGIQAALIKIDGVLRARAADRSGT